MASYFVREFKLPKYDVVQRRIELADMKVANEIWGNRVIDIKCKDESSYILVIYYK